MELDEETTTIAKGALWQNATGVFTKLLSFVYTVIVARFVAQEQVGIFYFALGIVGTIGIFADLGLSSAITRYVPYYLGKKDTEAAHKTVNVAVFLGVLLLSAASICTFALAGPIAQLFNNPPIEGVLRLFALHLAIIQVYTIANSLLFAFKQPQASAMGATLQSVLKLAFMLLLVFTFGANALSLAAAFIASYAIAAFYLLWELRKHFGWIAKTTRASMGEYFTLLCELVPFGIMVVGMMAFSTIINYSDKLMLGYFLQSDANAQIAIYSLATSLALIATMFSGSIISIFYPVVSGLVGKGDWKKVNKTSQTALKWLLFSSVPITAFLAAFSSPMLRVLYGIEYEPGSVALSLFAVGIFISYCAMIQRTVLAGMRLVKIDLLCVGIGALSNIFLNFLLIPQFGINGSALASLAAFIIMSALNQHYAHKYFGFSFPKSAWKNVLAGVFVFAALAALCALFYPYIVNLPLSLGDGMLFGTLDKLAKLAFLLCFFAIGAAIYLCLSNLLGLFEAEDVAVLRKVLFKFGIPSPYCSHIVRLIFWNKEIH